MRVSKWILTSCQPHRVTSGQANESTYRKQREGESREGESREASLVGDATNRISVTTKHLLFCDKNMLATTKLLPRQNYVCCDKNIVTTKITLVVAPANDREGVSKESGRERLERESVEKKKRLDSERVKKHREREREREQSCCFAL